MPKPGKHSSRKTKLKSSTRNAPQELARRCRCRMLGNTWEDMAKYLRGFDVELNSLEEFAGVSRSAVIAWEQTHWPCRLPADLKQFLHVSNGWSCKVELAGEIVGAMNVFPLDKIKEIPRCGATEEEEDEDKHIYYTIDIAFGYPVALVYSKTNDAPELSSPEIWMQDRSCKWHVVAPNFASYFRLMLLHFGIKHWQFKFSKYGMPVETKVLVDSLSPESTRADLPNARLHLDAKTLLS